MIEKGSWYTKKKYLHFDLPLNEKCAQALVRDPAQVARHPFYPLLKYTLTRSRIRKLPPGGERAFEKTSKERVIAYPAHRDGYIFSYYKSLLEVPYEKWLKANGLETAVTAFRPTGKNNIRLAKEAFDFIKGNPGCRILATDVEAFFDSIAHENLKEAWIRFLGAPKLPNDHFAVFKAIPRYSLIEKHKVFNLFRIRLSGQRKRFGQLQRICNPSQFREKAVSRGLILPNPGLLKGIGIPQGSQLSPLLSNMYMASVDLAMHQLVTGKGGKYWRYCDDILIVGPSEDSSDWLAELKILLKPLQLNLNSEKTQELRSKDLSSGQQLQYLGFVFNGSKTLIRSSSIQRFHRRTKKGIESALVRQDIDSNASGEPSPFRKKAIYNMYSELPVRGRKILERRARQKFSGNFTQYMSLSASQMESSPIGRQRKKILERLRSRIRKHDRSDGALADLA